MFVRFRAAEPLSFRFLCIAVGQDGGGGSVEDAVHRAALPVQIPRVSDRVIVAVLSSNQHRK